MAFVQTTLIIPSNTFHSNKSITTKSYKTQFRKKEKRIQNVF